MTQPDEDLIRAGIERRLAAVESLIPSRPGWRSAGDQANRIAGVRVVAGPALRERPRGDQPLRLLLVVGMAIGLLLAFGLLGGGGLRNLLPAVSPTPTAQAGALRPLIEPRFTVPVRPMTSWTVVEDTETVLGLVYLLEDLGSGGYHVGLMIAEPLGVYDPVAEDPLLPLPADLIGWIRVHPDLDADDPVALTVAGLPATAIDITVTYRPGGPKGETAQFIDIGGPWNLEYPSRKRIVLLQLPDGPVLIVFDSRPEFFDAGIDAFEAELARIQFEAP